MDLALDLPAGIGERRAVDQEASAPSDEPALVEEARAGAPEAFDRLYARYARMVHGILLARIPRRDVEDLVQDVFLTVHRRFNTLRDARAFGGWLAMIARNRAMDHARREPRHVELPEDVAAPASKDAEAAEALDAIRALPEAYREPLILRLVEGLTGPEIASRTGLTPGSVRVNLHRGMALLRQSLRRNQTHG